MAGFLSVQGSAVSQLRPRTLQSRPPPASACVPAISLPLATELSVSERASDEIGRMGPLDLL